ncbi:hypothetical protein T05_6039 [Trichinella murrelli]|uniref:Uncharacterized protein n=1 Tax=Trichinella murrelli TaxID=144512 RepID=A0A0V0UER6_9BILA|nr:hypothetical protein T05_6039 [Trichinella murrelli]
MVKVKVIGHWPANGPRTLAQCGSSGKSWQSCNAVGPVAREGKIERRQVELSKEAFFISQKQLAICVSLNTKRNLIKQRHDGQLLTNVRFYYEYVRLI